MSEKKRYLKSKDGKFKGSLPGAPSLTRLPAVPAAPVPVPPTTSQASSRNVSSGDSRVEEGMKDLGSAYRAMADAIEARIPRFHEMDSEEEKLERLIEFRRAEPSPALLSEYSMPQVPITRDFHEEGYASSYISRQHKTYEAFVKLDEENGKFEATVDNTVFGYSTKLNSATFDSEEEAIRFAKDNLTHHLQIVDKFRNAMNNDRNTLLATIDAQLLSDGYLKLAPMEQEDKFLAVASGKLPIRDCEFKFEFGRGLNRSVTVSKNKPDGTVSTYDYAAGDLDRVVLFALFVAYHD
jgi:hypothetical protein